MLKTFKPKSKILQKYVDLFYVLDNEESKTFSYAAYPHTNTCLSFIKGAKVERSNFEIDISGSEENATNKCIELIGKYTNPVFVIYQGEVRVVSIVFKPLGLNYFINENIKDIMPKFSQELTLADWTILCNKIFTLNNDRKQLELIEDFLLNHLKTLNFDNLYIALNLLEDIEKDYTIEQVADILEMNLKTFQRLFSKHMACSPLKYKRIARFRQSINYKLFSVEVKSLTEISYENNFYDQSYFIRDFKKLTQLNPRKFFEKISKLNQQEIIWIIK